MEPKKPEGVSVVGAPTINLEESIIQDLSKSETKVDSEIPKVEQVAPAFDISKLLPEQLQQLAAALRATPQQPSTNNEKRQIHLRAIGEGGDRKYVVDFKNAFVGLLDDPENNRKVERHIIPVRFEGTEEFVNVEYRKFMQFERVVCTVMDMVKREVPIKEGTTEDPYGQLVEKITMKVSHDLTVMTPEGRELKLEGKIANA